MILFWSPYKDVTFIEYWVGLFTVFRDNKFKSCNKIKHTKKYYKVKLKNILLVVLLKLNEIIVHLAFFFIQWIFQWIFFFCRVRNAFFFTWAKENLSVCFAVYDIYVSSVKKKMLCNWYFARNLRLQQAIHSGNYIFLPNLHVL